MASISCNQLVSSLVFEQDSSNATNTSTPTIWLEPDETSLFDHRIWSGQQCLIGLIISLIVISIPAFIIDRYFKHFDKKKRLNMMEDLDICPITQTGLITIFNPYLNHNKDVIQIIFTYMYSDHVIQCSSSLIDYSYDIIESSFGTCCCPPFWWALSIALLFLPAFFPMFYIIQHIKDSYKSYIEIDCQYYRIKRCDNWGTYYGPGKNGGKTKKRRNDPYDCQWEWSFDLNDVISCTDSDASDHSETEIGFDEYVRQIYNVSDYTIKAQTEQVGVDGNPVYQGDTCYMNMEDFKFRTGRDDCCGCGIRFGKIDCGCGCPNCLGYWFLSILVLAYIILIGWCMYQPFMETLDEYDIHFKSGTPLQTRFSAV